MFKLYRPLLLAAVTALSGTLTSCKQQDIEQPKPVKAPVRKKELSAEEKAKATRYQQAALLLLKITYDDKELLTALSKELEVDKYQHEQIGFQELFDASKVAQRGQSSLLSSFKSKFEKVFSTNDYPHAAEFAAKSGTAARGISQVTELEAALIQEGVNVYFPYSGDFGIVDNPTVTYAPLDNTTESTGYYYADTNNDGIKEVVEVTVDENYVQKHPTFIVQPLDEKESSATTETGSSHVVLGTQGKKDTINQVFIGYVQVTEQRDDLFGDGAGNSGGSEMRFVRPKGFLSIDANGQVDLTKEDPAIVSVDLSRKTIRDKNRTYQYITFDSNWERTEKTQYFVVYEYDNTAERTKTTKSTFEANIGVTLPGKSGGPSGTVGTKTTRELTEEIKYKTKEELIWQQDFSRPIFFFLNTQDQYADWRDGFPFWRAQSWMKFTMPRRQLIYEQ